MIGNSRRKATTALRKNGECWLAEELGLVSHHLQDTGALAATLEFRMDIAHSVNGVPIRLNYERWYHIVENHDELASYYDEVLETVAGPDFVVRGNAGALKAARHLGKQRWLVVVYREVSHNDGFVITAYVLNTRPKGKIAWRRQ